MVKITITTDSHGPLIFLCGIYLLIMLLENLEKVVQYFTISSVNILFGSSVLIYMPETLSLLPCGSGAAVLVPSLVVLQVLFIFP